MHKAIFIYSIAIVACLAGSISVRADTLTINNIRIYTLADLDDDTSTQAIPFSRAGNLIVVQAQADTIIGNFILDTGAPYLVLNITYFRDYPQQLVPDAEQTGMTNSSAAVARTRVKNFSFGSLNFSPLIADMANLGHIENSKGIKILGLLGMELFRQCEMIIDFEKNLIYLHKIGKKEATSYRHEMLKDTSTYYQFPIDITDNRIMINTVMAGKRLKFIIDCAAETNVLHSKLPDKIFDNVEITGRVMLNGVGNRKVEALTGDLKHMRIGNFDMGTMPVLVTNLENTCFAYGGCVDGILGFDFLSLHRIGFNFVKRKMYIWK